MRLVSWDESAQDGVVFGTTSGSPYVGMGNPAEADVVLIVNDLRAYVLVENSFKGGYSLDTDFLTGKGDLGSLQPVRPQRCRRIEHPHHGLAIPRGEPVEERG